MASDLYIYEPLAPLNASVSVNDQLAYASKRMLRLTLAALAEPGFVPPLRAALEYRAAARLLLGRRFDSFPGWLYHVTQAACANEVLWGLLVEHDLLRHARNPRNGHTAAHCSVLHRTRPKAFELQRAGVDLETLSDAGWSPLHMAAIGEWPDTLREFLDVGVDPDQRSRCANMTALHIVAETCRDYGAAMVTFLHHAGADLRAVDGFGRTPLDIAHDEGNWGAATTLRFWGA